MLIYGSMMCPDCVECCKDLDAAGIAYTFCEFSEDLAHLKAFLKIRDTAESHAPVREKHSVGIPCIQIDEEVMLVNGPDHAKELVEKYNLLSEE